jgi:two-component system NtrC family sensor kinase
MAEMPENKRIICVDDEKDIVQAYADFLAPAPSATPKRSSRGAPTATPSNNSASPDYEILRAYSGEEAIKIVETELAAGRHIAGGFFDVKMHGGIDGIQTIQEIWKRDPEINCTIVTAYQDRSVQDINELFGERFKDQWDYLNKPFNLGEITQKARQMTAAWNRRQSLAKALDDLKNAHLALVQSERMAAIGQLARGVGHEFGNILQRIVGKSDLALGENDLGKLHDSFTVVLQAAEQASLIVQNLQAMSKNSPSNKTAVNIKAVFADTLRLVHHELTKNSVNINDKSTDCPPILANAVELQQVFMNLVINALHAMQPKGGILEVGCGVEGTTITAWVKDSGCGIPADVLPRIFEYAFTTKGDKGNGLGLSITKQIIEKHNGTIQVTSAPGSGTTFKLVFPGGATK